MLHTEVTPAEGLDSDSQYDPLSQYNALYHNGVHLFFICSDLISMLRAKPANNRFLMNYEIVYLYECFELKSD